MDFTPFEIFTLGLLSGLALAFAYEALYHHYIRR